MDRALPVPLTAPRGAGVERAQSGSLPLTSFANFGGSPASMPSLFSIQPSLAAQDEAAALVAEQQAIDEGRRKRAEYRTVKVIGSGTQGTVKLAIHLPTGQEVALKSVRKPHGAGRTKSHERETTANEVRREVAILQQLRHEHLCRFFDAFETGSKFYIVMDLCSGGSLFERIQNLGHFDEANAAVCVATIANAVMYLHDHGVCHRDLKPENLLFKDRSPNSRLILVDFGVAGVSKSAHRPESQGMTTIAGTPFFLAPELVTSAHNRSYTNKIDVWSLGVITHQLLLGTTPFQDSTSFTELYKRIVRADFQIPSSAPISNLARDFIRTLLEPNPDKRPSAAQVLQHPWILEYCPRPYLMLLHEFNVEADRDMYRGRTWDGKAVHVDDEDGDEKKRMLGAAAEQEDDEDVPIFDIVLNEPEPGMDADRTPRLRDLSISQGGASSANASVGEAGLPPSSWGLPFAGRAESRASGPQASRLAGEGTLRQQWESAGAPGPLNIRDGSTGALVFGMEGTSVPSGLGEPNSAEAPPRIASLIPDVVVVAASEVYPDLTSSPANLPNLLDHLSRIQYLQDQQQQQEMVAHQAEEAAQKVSVNGIVRLDSGTSFVDSPVPSTGAESGRTLVDALPRPIFCSENLHLRYGPDAVDGIWDGNGDVVTNSRSMPALAFTDHYPPASPLVMPALITQSPAVVDSHEGSPDLDYDSARPMWDLLNSRHPRSGSLASVTLEQPMLASPRTPSTGTPTGAKFAEDALFSAPPEPMAVFINPIIAQRVGLVGSPPRVMSASPRIPDPSFASLPRRVRRASVGAVSPAISADFVMGGSSPIPATGGTASNSLHLPEVFGGSDSVVRARSLNSLAELEHAGEPAQNREVKRPVQSMRIQAMIGLMASGGVARVD